ncbi:translation initiation factor IF-2 [Coralloluteibacterium stylophorae]|uniref:Translation initiation factor IF-2 n=1 Tax=Coralloluteibacterium stylophorae TaxID=1776034 RepID=A0AAP2CC82_9GAMM|nr:translation initiation factor IF-2 [Coralloluteibacterium stylophorae]MBS7457584.1 translation initiation factor IF-2 [Coralloluteibacterium stylophorae]
MSEVTVRTLAKLVGTPVEKLMEQLGEAGMTFDGPDQVVTPTEKMKLLGFLRRTHGKTETPAAEDAPRQITLKRRKVQELTVAAGKSKSTVNVEVRQKRTYVKRSDAPAQADAEREDAQRKLDESRSRQAAEEQAREDAERAHAEAEQRAEEARRQEEAEAAEAAALRAEAERVEAEAKAKADAIAARPPRTVDEDRISIRPKNPTILVDVKKRDEERRAAAAAAAPAPTPSAGPRPGKTAPRGGERERDDRGGRRFGSGPMHLSDSDRARRSSGKKKGVRGRGVEQARSGGGAHGFARPTAPVAREVAIGDNIVVSDLAQKLAIKGADVVKALFKMGVMATINQSIDHDTAVLVVEELGHTAVRAQENDAETALEAHTEVAGDRSPRPPVVTIMGHVDHGKTSLLDYIRRTKVASGEAGGITQHIGAYHVETAKGVVSFLDTPGHAAFTSMRARGAKLTDIVVLVVAADDGVMPQTIEAIQHARAAKVPLIVAVNKIDKSDANAERVKQELIQHDVVAEDFGGDVQVVPISAKTGQGVDDLLDAIILQSEFLELTAVFDARAAGVVVEASLDKGRGPVATVLVQQGTLNRGDYMVCGVHYGRVRALFDENGQQVQSAGPSIPVQVLGLSGVSSAGDDFVVVADERLAKEVAQQREAKARESRLGAQGAQRMEDIMAQMGQGDQQQLNLVIKADVQGSAEALREALTALSNDMIKINVIISGVGGITESDATRAAASKATIIGFNVRADASARKVIETGGLDLRYFSIIYDVIDQVKQVASGLLGMEIREEIIGTAEVRDVFRSSKFGAVAGSMVVEGVVRRNKPIRVLRDNTVIFEGELESLRRFKENVDEVRAGTECGIAVKQYNDVKPGDQIECFERIEVARTL